MEENVWNLPRSDVARRDFLKGWDRNGLSLRKTPDLTSDVQTFRYRFDVGVTRLARSVLIVSRLNGSWSWERQQATLVREERLMKEDEKP